MPVDPNIALSFRPPEPVNPFAIAMQAQQMRAYEENRRALEEQRLAMAEQRRAQADELQRRTAAATGAVKALQAGAGVRDSTLAWARTNAPDALQGLTEYFDKADERTAQIRKLQNDLATQEADFVGDLADGALKHGNGSLPAIRTALDYAVERIPDYQQHADALWQRVQGMDDAGRAALLAQLRDSAPSRRTKNTPQVVGGALVDDTGKVIYQAPEKAKPVYRLSPDKRTLEQVGEVPAGAQVVSEPQPPRVNVSMGGPGAVTMTDKAIDYAAAQVRILGQNAGVLTRLNDDDRKRIMNRVAAQAETLGQSPAAVIQRQSAFKADSQALARMTTMKSAAESFETKAQAQAQKVLELSDAVGRAKWPIVNKALMAGKVSVMGDEKASLFLNAVLTFTTEYAKIIEGSTGSAQGSSDAARKAAQTLLNTAMNKGTVKGAVDLMQWEMQQTIKGYDATIAHITERQMGGAAPNPAGNPKDPMGIR